MSRINLVKALDFWEMCGGERRINEDGKFTNRSSAYDLVRRLPADVKVRIGKTLYVNVPKAQELIDRGGSVAHIAHDLRRDQQRHGQQSRCAGQPEQRESSRLDQPGHDDRRADAQTARERSNQQRPKKCPEVTACHR